MFQSILVWLLGSAGNPAAVPPVPAVAGHRKTMILLVLLVLCGISYGGYRALNWWRTPGSNVKWAGNKVKATSGWADVIGEKARSLDPKIRQTAIRQAMKTGRPETFPVIVTLLIDSDKTVKDEAHDAMVKAGKCADDADVKNSAIGKDAVKALVEALSNNASLEIKVRACACLIKIGKPAVEQVIEALVSDNDIVHKCAQHTLYKIGTPTKEALEKAFDDSKRPARVSSGAEEVLNWLETDKAPEFCPLADKVKAEAEIKAVAEAEEAEYKAKLEVAIARAEAAATKRLEAREAKSTTLLLEAMKENGLAKKQLAETIRESNVLRNRMQTLDADLLALLARAKELQPPPSQPAPRAVAPVPRCNNGTRCYPPRR